MDHEVAHALARHGVERMSQQMVAQAIGELLAFGVGKVGPGLHDDFLKHYGMGALLEFTAMGTSARIRSRSHWAHSHGKSGIRSGDGSGILGANVKDRRRQTAGVSVNTPE
jgi:hypothetical protein